MSESPIRLVKNRDYYIKMTNFHLREAENAEAWEMFEVAKEHYRVATQAFVDASRCLETENGN